MCRGMSALLRLTVLILASSHVRGFKIYKDRQALMNLLVPVGEAVEERLFTEHCKQSSDGGNCNLAQDGHIINEWTQCASTQVEKSAFWSARLETPSYVTRVVIHTSEFPDSSLTNGLSDFALLASGLECFRHISSETFQSRSFPCDSLADKISIQSHRMNSVLSLCEVEVYGVPVTFQGIETGAMELSMPTCDQSSTIEERECSHATDRAFILREVSGKMCTKTDKEDNPWWAGYFAEAAMVTHVKVFGREDCCPGALYKFEIRVNEIMCTQYDEPAREDKSYAPMRPTVFSCRGFGNYVQVYSLKENVQMSLCQVQVFGHKILLLPDTLYSLLGCYKDDPLQPDFEQLVSNTMMSPAKCHRICKRNNKAYFGLQNGQVCMCGAKYGRHGKGEGCTIPCRDNRVVMCGGRGFNSVYEIVL